MSDVNVFENKGVLAQTDTVMGGSGGGEGVVALPPTLLDAALALARKGFPVFRVTGLL